MVTSREDPVAESSISSSKSRSTTPASANLLSVLQCPKASELARKCTTDCNPPKGKHSHDKGVSNVNSVAPLQRVRKFPNESLTVSNSKLCFVKPVRRSSH